MNDSESTDKPTLLEVIDENDDDSMTDNSTCSADSMTVCSGTAEDSNDVKVTAKDTDINGTNEEKTEQNHTRTMNITTEDTGAAALKPEKISPLPSVATNKNNVQAKNVTSPSQRRPNTSERIRRGLAETLSIRLSGDKHWSKIFSEHDIVTMMEMPAV